MPTVKIEGIKTNYQVVGQGEPILMFSPGGFDARIEKWTKLGVYKKIQILKHLSANFQCILFDRRENGQSGGKVERIGWSHFAKQGLGLLDHLKIKRAHVLGGCMGCCPVTTLAAEVPERVLSMTLYWPVGGARYRINNHIRFARHLAYVQEYGLQGVADLALSHEKNFSTDPRPGPWAQPIRNSPEFVTQFVSMDQNAYLNTVSALSSSLFDRDTAPGAEPEALLNLDIPCLIVPGADAAHATSSARYLQECINGSEYWDVGIDEQTENNAPERILKFLESTSI